jgi:hypothetical protein
LALLALALMVLASALVPITAGSSTVATASFAQAVTGQAGPAERARDDDLVFYDRLSSGSPAASATTTSSSASSATGLRRQSQAQRALADPGPHRIVAR